MKAATFISEFNYGQIFATVILLVVYFLLRFTAEKLLLGKEALVNVNRRRLLSYTRNTFTLLLILGLLMIWAPALRTLALSVTAFILALVLATKEIILCLTGGLLRTSIGAISVGDWVRIGEVRGEVMDQALLAVTLQELEPDGGSNQFTGRTISIPNSVFLTTQIINENFAKNFIYHTVTLCLERDDNPLAVAQCMEQAMNLAITDSRELASRYNTLIRKRAGVSMPQTDARTHFSTSADGHPIVSVTAFIPTGQTEQVERLVLAEVFAALYRQRSAHSSALLDEVG